MAYEVGTDGMPRPTMSDPHKRVGQKAINAAKGARINLNKRSNRAPKIAPAAGGIMPGGAVPPNAVPVGGPGGPLPMPMPMPVGAKKGAKIPLEGSKGEEKGESKKKEAAEVKAGIDKPGFKGGGNWIADATKNKGGLHRALGVPEGEKIPKSKVAAAAGKKGKVGKEARLAQTLAGLGK